MDKGTYEPKGDSAQAFGRNWIVTEVGAWEMKDNSGKDVSYPYIGIFNGDRNLKLSVDKSCVLPADLSFGDRVDVWIRLDQASKAAGDRAFDVVKLKAVNVERVAAALKRAA
jgi:hypothetical protein